MSRTHHKEVEPHKNSEHLKPVFKRPNKRFIPNIQVEFDNPAYPEAPEDWERLTDYGNPAPIIWGKDVPNYFHVTALEAEGIQSYQEDQDKLTQLQPRYLLKEQRRDSSRWQPKKSDADFNLLRPLYVLFILTSFNQVHSNGTESVEPQENETFATKIHKKRIPHRVYAFTRGSGDPTAILSEKGRQRITENTLGSYSPISPIIEVKPYTL